MIAVDILERKGLLIECRVGILNALLKCIEEYQLGINVELMSRDDLREFIRTFTDAVYNEEEADNMGWERATIRYCSPMLEKYGLDENDLDKIR